MVALLLRSCALCLCIDSSSNIIAQYLRAWNRDEPFVLDVILLIHFACYSCIMCPVNYAFQTWLERKFPGWKLVTQRPQKPLASLGENDDDIPLEEQNAKPNNRNSQDIERHDDLVEEQVRVRHWKNIWTRWFTDCITLGALFNVTAFLLIMGVFKGKSVSEIALDLKNELIPIILNSYILWPLGGFLIMVYSPAELRVVFYSCCGLIWSIYLSLVAARL